MAGVDERLGNLTELTKPENAEKNGISVGSWVAKLDDRLNPESRGAAMYTVERKLTNCRHHLYLIP